MDSRSDKRIGLMAIRPIYAQAILNGRKCVEFRKRALAADISTVLLYETSPTQAIVGSFDVARIELGSPRKLWRRYETEGGIGSLAFNAYYENSNIGAAILVNAVRRFEYPVPLSALNPRPSVPQSFSYVSGTAFDQAEAYLCRCGSLASMASAAI
jgi:predicted transcriptional regulator